MPLTVFANRALALTLWMKIPSTYTFSESLIVMEYNHIFEIVFKVIVAVILIKHQETLLRFRACIIEAKRITSEITHHLKRVLVIFQKWAWFFFYSFLKFDNINADVSFQERGHNFETEGKLNRAWHPFSEEVSWNIPADFQLNPLEDARKRTKNVDPLMQFCFIEKKTKILSWDW